MASTRTGNSTSCSPGTRAAISTTIPTWPNGEALEAGHSFTAPKKPIGPPSETMRPASWPWAVEEVPTDCIYAMMHEAGMVDQYGGEAEDCPPRKAAIQMAFSAGWQIDP